MNTTITHHQETNFFARWRFANELRRIVAENRNILIIAAASIAIIVLAVELFVEFIHSGENIQHWNRNIYDAPLTYDIYTVPKTLFQYMVAGLLATMCIGASAMFREMSTKEKRTNYLTSPTTPAEKLLAQLVVYYFAPILIFVVSYVIADFLRPILFRILYIDQRHTEFRSVFVMSDYIIPQLRFLIGFQLPMFVFLSTLFMYGSIAYPKASFIKTFCLISLLELALLAWVAILISAFNVESFSLLDTLKSIVSTRSAVMSLFYAAALFNLFAVWLRIKESDVIVNR